MSPKDILLTGDRNVDLGTRECIGQHAKISGITDELNFPVHGPYRKCDLAIDYMVSV